MRYTFINLRKTIDELNATSGWTWMALRKADLTRKCHCVAESSAASPTASPNCPRCFGDGHLFVDYIVRGFHWVATPGVEFSTPAGTISTLTNYGVLRWHDSLNSHDMLLHLALDRNTGQPETPFKIIGVFAIQECYPVYGDFGRVEYWKMVLEERTFTAGRAGEIGTNQYSDPSRANPGGF